MKCLQTRKSCAYVKCLCYQERRSKKDLDSIKKIIISSEEMKNSDNHIPDNDHSFFGKYFNPSRYTGNIMSKCFI